MRQSAKQPRSPVQRWPWLALGIAISLTFVWLIVRESRFEALAGSFVALSFPILLAALGRSGPSLAKAKLAACRT